MPFTNSLLVKQPVLTAAVITNLSKFSTLLQLAGLDRFDVVFYPKKRMFLEFFKVLKNHFFLQCNQVTDIVGLDYPNRSYRFNVIYQLLSYRYNFRCRVVVATNEVSGIPSLVNMFAGTNWQEREVWDLFGIVFLDHPDLRRILTDYGFYGFPLRKDFPVSGFYELWFNDVRKRLQYQRVTFAQEYRDFGSVSGWVKN